MKHNPEYNHSEPRRPLQQKAKHCSTLMKYFIALLLTITWYSSKVLATTILGSKCQHDMDCTDFIKDSTCSIQGYCECAPYYVQYNNSSCLSSQLLGGDCILNEQCTMKVAKSSCLDGVCRCVAGFLQYRKHTCMRPAPPGSVCYSHTHCQMFNAKTHCDFLLPNLFGRCQCTAPAKHQGSDCVEPTTTTSTTTTTTTSASTKIMIPTETVPDLITEQSLIQQEPIKIFNNSDVKETSELSVSVAMEETVEITTKSDFEINKNHVTEAPTLLHEHMALNVNNKEEEKEESSQPANLHTSADNYQPEKVEQIDEKNSEENLNKIAEEDAYSEIDKAPSHLNMDHTMNFDYEAAQHELQESSAENTEHIEDDQEEQRQGEEVYKDQHNNVMAHTTSTELIMTPFKLETTSPLIILDHHSHTPLSDVATAAQEENESVETSAETEVNINLNEQQIIQQPEMDEMEEVNKEIQFTTEPAQTTAIRINDKYEFDDNNSNNNNNWNEQQSSTESHNAEEITEPIEREPVSIDYNITDEMQSEDTIPGITNAQVEIETDHSMLQQNEYNKNEEEPEILQPDRDIHNMEESTKDLEEHLPTVEEDEKSSEIMENNEEDFNIPVMITYTDGAEGITAMSHLENKKETLQNQNEENYDEPTTLNSEMEQIEHEEKENIESDEKDSQDNLMVQENVKDPQEVEKIDENEYEATTSKTFDKVLIQDEVNEVPSIPVIEKEQLSVVIKPILPSAITENSFLSEDSETENINHLINEDKYEQNEEEEEKEDPIRIPTQQIINEDEEEQKTDQIQSNTFSANNEKDKLTTQIYPDLLPDHDLSHNLKSNLNSKETFDQISDIPNSTESFDSVTTLQNYKNQYNEEGVDLSENEVATETDLKYTEQSSEVADITESQTVQHEINNPIYEEDIIQHFKQPYDDNQLHESESDSSSSQITSNTYEVAHVVEETNNAVEEETTHSDINQNNVDVTTPNEYEKNTILNNEVAILEEEDISQESSTEVPYTTVEDMSIQEGDDFNYGDLEEEKVTKHSSASTVSTNTAYTEKFVTDYEDSKLDDKPHSPIFEEEISSQEIVADVTTEGLQKQNEEEVVDDNTKKATLSNENASEEANSEIHVEPSLDETTPILMDVTQIPEKADLEIDHKFTVPVNSEEEENLDRDNLDMGHSEENVVHTTLDTELNFEEGGDESQDFNERENESIVDLLNDLMRDKDTEPIEAHLPENSADQMALWESQHKLQNEFSDLIAEDTNVSEEKLIPQHQPSHESNVVTINPEDKLITFYPIMQNLPIQSFNNDEKQIRIESGESDQDTKKDKEQQNELDLTETGNYLPARTVEESYKNEEIYHHLSNLMADNLVTESPHDYFKPNNHDDDVTTNPDIQMEFTTQTMLNLASRTTVMEPAAPITTTLLPLRYKNEATSDPLKDTYLYTEETATTKSVTELRKRVELSLEAISLGLRCSNDRECQLADPYTVCNENNVCDCAANSYGIVREQEERCSVENRGCSSGTFQCRSSGVCISWFFVCDGRTDCSDASDEDCTFNSRLNLTCPSEAFHCKQSGRCISRAALCDGRVQCPHGEDELGCENLKDTDTCPPHTFRCNSGECLPEYEYCNAIISCRDGSDEPPHLCGSRSMPNLFVELFRAGGLTNNNNNAKGYCPHRCSNGRCRSTAIVCSGRDGCGDGTDEQTCSVCRCPVPSLNKSARVRNFLTRHQAPW